MKGIYQPIAAHLQQFCKDGEFVIYRDSFRWKKYDPENEYGDPVMSNHYDSMELEQLCDDFRYEIDWEFWLTHVAIVKAQKQKRPSQPKLCRRCVIAFGLSKKVKTRNGQLPMEHRHYLLRVRFVTEDFPRNLTEYFTPFLGRFFQTGIRKVG